MNRVHTCTALLFAAVVASGCASHGGAQEGKETPVAMNDVPASVRATLEREAAGGRVTEVEKEMKNGKTVYSADVTIGGKGWDIVVAEDGSVLSKELEKAGEK
jgi:uncharacterized membrane protein YkoI